MKLVRHFLAVSLAVGVVVGLGFVWSTSGAAGIVADDRGIRIPRRGQPGASDAIANDFGRQSGGFSLSNVGDLVQTLLIVALITAAVVIVDRARRRRRPIPRPTGTAGRDPS